MSRPNYVNVDELQGQTTLQEAAAKCGVTLDLQGSGKEVRIDCLFGCSGDHVGKREIAVNTSNPQKIFCCHSYGCQFRGNLLTLMHGMLTGAKPTADKLTGVEFAHVKKVLAGTVESAISSLPKAASQTAVSEPPISLNIPLAESDNPKARDLVNLHERLIVDVAHMPPSAASYVRRHACLSADAMRKWTVGVLPTGGDDKRGWSLRGHIVYPLRNEEGKILGWIARDPDFELKEKTFLALSPDQRQHEKMPHKHKIPVGLHRGLELFGQHASRLQEPGYREQISKYGLIVVEGFNDVIALDNMGIPAVAIMSNKITVEQVSKVERWSRQLSQGRVSLLFDADGPGDDGAKEALWLLSERGLDVRLGWTQRAHSGVFAGRQPEQLSQDERDRIVLPRLGRV